MVVYNYVSYMYFQKTPFMTSSGNRFGCAQCSITMSMKSNLISSAT